MQSQIKGKTKVILFNLLHLENVIRPAATINFPRVFCPSFIWSCEPNNQLNVCTTSVTEGEVARVKQV